MKNTIADIIASLLVFISFLAIYSFIGFEKTVIFMLFTVLNVLFAILNEIKLNK